MQLKIFSKLNVYYTYGYFSTYTVINKTKYRLKIMALRFPENPLYELLRDEKVEEFNSQRESAQQIDFHDCDFRGLDLRGLNAIGINFSGCYFRAADLRGIDFSRSILDGASLAAAQISGCYFPKDIDAAEISVSVDKGIRMRARVISE